MFTIGNDELDKMPVLNKFVKCPHCNKRHKIKYGNKILPDGTEAPSTMLAFYVCGDKTYLAGINGKSVMGRKYSV